MTPNKSSLELPAPGGDVAERGVRRAQHNAVANYRRAALFLSHAETIDALRRAQAAFAEAGKNDAAARCAELRRQVEAGGLDELPPLSELGL